MLPSLNAKPARGTLDSEAIMDFFGVGEPLAYRSAWSAENLNVNKAFEIMRSLGVSRLREWVWRWMVFNESGTGLRENIVEAFNEIIMEAKSRNITVIGMVQDFPSWMTGIEGDNQAVPRRNLTEGSSYREFLEKYEKSWESLARGFPEIEIWEIGNEYNLPQFLHPPEYNESDSDTWFNYSDTVDIVTDLLYYGSLGIKAGNPNATTVMGGLGPRENGIHDIEVFLDSVYKNIKSGRWPSTDPDDFFQVVSWHPYIFSEKPTEQNWIIPNVAVYNIMVSHGDGDKPVVFSEFGYSDVCTGLNETQVAEYLYASFILAWENFQPWLKTIYWFRLIDPDPCYDVMPSLAEYGFGLVKRPAENYVWKPAAYAYKMMPLIIEEFPVRALLVITVILTSLTPILTKFLRRRKISDH
jgi:hypothetical protein